MYCSKCEKKQNEENNYCSHCGNSLINKNNTRNESTHSQNKSLLHRIIKVRKKLIIFFIVPYIFLFMNSIHNIIDPVTITCFHLIHLMS